ncbi:MAG: hypothetical protein ABSB42_16365 [Tepidisphaeraceae bacterium]|jgi:uncharacterized protein DUF3352
MRYIAALVVVLMVVPAFCRAQTLADRLPDDTVFYLGWKGVDSLGPDYDQSHLKGIADASHLRQLLADSLPRLVHRIGDFDPQSGAAIDAGLQIAGDLARHPSAFYVGPLDAANAEMPIPRIAIVCDAGADAPAMAKTVADFIAQVPAGANIRCKTADQRVIISTFDFPDQPQSTLAADRDFQAAFSQLGKDPVASLYLNGIAMNAVIDQMVGKFGGPSVKPVWPAVRDALGLAGLQRVAWTSGLDGKNWLDQGFIQAPAPRHGLLAMVGSERLSDDLIKLIPQSATVAGVGSFDVNQLLNVILTAVQQAAPDNAQQVNSVTQMINQTLGVDLQKDVLGLFGSQWVYYVDPNKTGSGSLGFVGLNRPKDPARLDASLTNLGTAINNLLHQQLGDKKLTLEFRETTLDGVQIHYFAAPALSPAWAIKDGTLIFAMYPQSVVAAVQRQSDGKAILDNPEFQHVQSKLGSDHPDFAELDGFTFVDLSRTIPQSYASWLFASQLYLGLGDLFGLQSPAMVLPPLDTLLAQIEPAGSISWTDDSGFHEKTVSPFPGAEMLGADNAAAGYVMQLASTLTPTLVPLFNHEVVYSAPARGK